MTAKRNKPAAVAATVSSRKNTAVSLAQNNAEDGDGNMLVDDKDSLGGDDVAVLTLKRKRQLDVPDGASTVLNVCRGVYDGNFSPALSFAGQALLNTGCQLLQWARQPDAGMRSFASSILAQSSQICLPYYGLTIERATATQDGFVFRYTDCGGDCRGGNSRNPRCDTCGFAHRNSMKMVKKAHIPNAIRAGSRSRIDYIANDPMKARIEIEALRKENSRLRYHAQRYRIYVCMSYQPSRHPLSVARDQPVVAGKK